VPEITQQLNTALADRYVIERELGAGGMATVYLANDVKHERKVALKVLKPELAAVIGAERFLAEIKVTANLQHPHILPLHDSGEAESFLYYVMPYVEGETLRDKIDRQKQLGVEEAVEIARSVASALDYAHRQEVIHRDIKPENILLHDGQPMVADFGIALALSHAGGTRLTETGLSIGTPHYMSPEQAMGDRELDARSDVYSLGAMLYEMLTGEPPYTGPTAQSIVAKVITEKAPPVTAGRPTTPGHVAASIDKSLQKLPADRFSSAAEFSEALARPGMVTAPSAAVSGAPPMKRLAGWMPWAAAAVTLAAGLLIGRSIAGPEPSAGQVVRFTIPIGPEEQLSGAPTQTITLSRDGSMLGYIVAGGGNLFVRHMESLVPTRIDGVQGADNPYFSPDGEWIAFDKATGELGKAPVAGGPSQRVTLGSNNGGISWTEAGDIVFKGVRPGLMIVPGSGGDATPFVLPDTASGELELYFPDMLPGGAVLVTFNARGLATPRLGGTGVAVVWPETGERKVLIPSGAGGALYSRTGHIVYTLEDGTLQAAPFDVERMEITGDPVVVAQNVHIAGSVPQFSISDDGTLAYVPARVAEMVLVTREGQATIASDATRQFHSPRISPDGRRVVVDISDLGSRDVWVQDLEQGTLTRVSFEGDANDPVWMPDGRRVCYATGKSGTRGVFCRNADGAGEADSIYVGDDEFTAGVWLPSGDSLVLISQSTETLYNLWLHAPGGGEPRPVLNSSFSENFPAVSPDGKWLAYVTDESGRMEIYVRSLSGGGGRVQVSRDGGQEPAWSRDGRDLFYLETGGGGSRMMAVAVTTEPQFRVRSRTPLFDARDYERAAPHANYDVGPDGRFVMIRRAAASEVVIVQNWHLLVDAPDAR
jgi:serine/threonine-protein kinase